MIECRRRLENVNNGNWVKHDRGTAGQRRTGVPGHATTGVDAGSFGDSTGELGEIKA
jgi:hypothetical protein